MIRALAIAFALLSAMPSAASAPIREVLLVDLRGTDHETKLATLVMQGIANRGGPRVFLVFGDECRWLRWDFESGADNGVGRIWSAAAAEDMRRRHPLMEDAWMEILVSEGCRFTPVSPAGLLATLRAEWRGFLLYQDFSTDLAPAATRAGIGNLIPVNAKLLAKLREAGIDAPVASDYTKIRASFPKDQDPRLAGHRWLIDQLLPRCRRNGAVSRVRNYGLAEHDTFVDIDTAVLHRWPVYDLSHIARENRAANQRKETPDPPDKAYLDELLAGLEPWSFVHGWGKGGEESFIRSLNRHRLLGEVSGVPNTSFFAKLPAPAPPFRQKRRPVDPAKPAVEDKIYVAFMVNEGDTLKTAATFMGFGSWLQPERGSIPINWGIMPNLLVSHPWLMNYYYRTMTENDFFFAAPSGWGYAHPGFLPPGDLMPYAAMVRNGMQLADLRHINVWWINDLRERKHPFLKATGALGHVDWAGDQAVEFPSNGITNVRSNHFYTYKRPAADFAKMLVDDMKDVSPPWFVAIYGAFDHGTPHRFKELAGHLPQERFKIVALDEMFAAAEKSRGRLQGRVWLPGPGAPKGVAP
jgi:hypothetical protein